MTQVKMLSIDVMSVSESSGEQSFGKSNAKDGAFGHLVNEQIRQEQGEQRTDSRQDKPASESQSKSDGSTRAEQNESDARKEGVGETVDEKGADSHSLSKEDVASAEKQKLNEQNKAKAKDKAASSEGTSSERESPEGESAVIVDAEQKNSAKELFDFLNKSNQLLQAEESASNAESDEIESLTSIKLTTSDLSLFKGGAKESLSGIKSVIAENAKLEQGAELDRQTTEETDQASELDSKLIGTEAELNAEISKFNEYSKKVTSEASELSKQMAAKSADSQAGAETSKLDSSNLENAESKSAQLQKNKLSQEELKSSLADGVINNNLSAEEASEESIELEALVKDLAEQTGDKALSGKNSNSQADANATGNSSKTNADLLAQQIERTAQQTSDEKVNLDELSTEEKLVQGIQTNPQAQRVVNGDSKSSTNEYISQLQNNVAQSSNNAEGSSDEAETNADGDTQAENKVLVDGQVSPTNTQTRSSFAETLAATLSGQPTSSPSQPIHSDADSIQQQLDAVSARVVESNQTLTKAEQKLQIETINIYQKDFANAVKDKVMIMVNQRLQQVEIQLDPPELGNVHVRLNLQSEQASVSFLVQNQQAKEALEQQMGKLRDMLQESGVDVGDANVAQQQQSQQGDKEHNMAGGFHKDTEEDQMVSANLAQVIKPSATGVDFYA